jgi:hypothetical protein
MAVRRQCDRVELRDGGASTVHVVGYLLASSHVRVVPLQPETPLEEWCGENGVPEAVSGGFAVKPEYVPLGELWVDGASAPHRPFRAPWSRQRAALIAGNGSVSIDHRHRLPERPERDLLQAGPLLVRDGRSAIAGADDPEGFSATAEEFDEDITADREPRLAVALTADAILAVAADGRGPDDAGLTLWEFADVLVGLGAERALNLDAGSAGVIISGGHRVNTPRDGEGAEMHPSSPAVNAIVFG